MRRKIKSKTLRKRVRTKQRIRNKIEGTATVPRVTVTKSLKNISVQAIDDTAGVTLVSATTVGMGGANSNIKSAKLVGAKLAEGLKGKGIKTVVFDRNGYIYHGKVAAVADSIRENDIKI